MLQCFQKTEEKHNWFSYFGRSKVSEIEVHHIVPRTKFGKHVGRGLMKNKDNDSSEIDDARINKSIVRYGFAPSKSM